MRKPCEVVVEMIFGNHQREMRVGVGVESFGDKDVRAEEHRAAPEFREQGALDFDVADVGRVWRIGDGRDDLVEDDGDGIAAGVQRDFSRRGVEVAGRELPVLAFAAIHGKFYRGAIGAMKGFVLVQDHLDEVIAGGDVVEVADGVAEGCVVKRDGLAGLYGVHVEAEDHLGAHGITDLQARFGGGIGGENQQQAAVERLWRFARLGTRLRSDTTKLVAREAAPALRVKAKIPSSTARQRLRDVMVPPDFRLNSPRGFYINRNWNCSRPWV